MNGSPHVRLEDLLAIQARIARAGLRDALILGGSSALLVIDPEIPPLTRDLDFLVDEAWLAREEQRVYEALERVGLTHLAGTAAFEDPDRRLFDLVGYSTADAVDRVGGGARLGVAVFGDLGLLLGDPAAVETPPGGGPCLSPAAFCAAKLATLRLDKGPKDRLHALAVIGGRHEEPAFRRDLARLLGRLGDRETLEDMLADARTALMMLQRDPLLASPDTAPYVEFLRRLQQGLAALAAILDEADGGA